MPQNKDLKRLVRARMTETGKTTPRPWPICGTRRSRTAPGGLADDRQPGTGL